MEGFTANSNRLNKTSRNIKTSAFNNENRNMSRLKQIELIMQEYNK